MILLPWTALILGLLLRGHGRPVNSSPRKHQWHQVKGTVGGSISLALNLMPGEMEGKSHLDFQPLRGEGLELAIFMGGHWKRSESPDRFGQRLELASETVVRITGLEMEDSGLFKVSVRLPLAKIWYHTFNLTVYGSGYHSLRYVYTGVSEPSPGLPWFTSVGYVDGQRFFHYDSEERKVKSGVPWMEKVDQEDPHYWDQVIQTRQRSESSFRGNLAVLRNRYNQSGGLHTFQLMNGCDLNEDMPTRGYKQYSYEGRDFIAFDKETLTWTATDAVALISKRKLEAEPALAQRRKAYLEKECVEWLRKYLQYGKETLLRKEPPTVKVTRKDSREGLETLFCQAYGFYPKEINITWRKDREIRHEDTFHGVVSPNADGTYYTWLSIEVNPKVRSSYQCHVEHDGLQEPLDITMEESVPVWVSAVGVSVSGLLVLMVVAGLILLKKKSQGKTKKAAPSEHEVKRSVLRGSNSSADSLIPSQCGTNVERTHQGMN